MLPPLTIAPRPGEAPADTLRRLAAAMVNLEHGALVCGEDLGAPEPPAPQRGWLAEFPAKAAPPGMPLEGEAIRLAGVRPGFWAVVAVVASPERAQALVAPLAALLARAPPPPPAGSATTFTASPSASFAPRRTRVVTGHRGAGDRQVFTWRVLGMGAALDDAWLDAPAEAGLLGACLLVYDEEACLAGDWALRQAGRRGCAAPPALDALALPSLFAPFRPGGQGLALAGPGREACLVLCRASPVLTTVLAACCLILLATWRRKKLDGLARQLPRPEACGSCAGWCFPLAFPRAGGLACLSCELLALGAEAEAEAEAEVEAEAAGGLLALAGRALLCPPPPSDLLGALGALCGAAYAGPRTFASFVGRDGRTYLNFRADPLDYATAAATHGQLYCFEDASGESRRLVPRSIELSDAPLLHWVSRFVRLDKHIAGLIEGRP